MSLDWFCANGLVGKGDADAARNRDDYVVARQVSRFQTDLAVVQAIGNQLSIASVGPVSPALADLASGIFDLLPHTPVTAVGINFMAHFKMEDFDTYHQIGDKLAPKDIWNDIFPERVAGLANLTILIQEGTREVTATPNNKRITVQPSNQVRPGLYLQINNHFEVDVAGVKLERAKVAAGVIKENWEHCLAESEELFDRIIRKALAKS